MNILDEIKTRVLLCDGAWGTLLQQKGLQPGECPELWNLTRRDDVLDIARSYIEAGADIIETNSFGGSRIKLSQYGLDDKASLINETAASISREAAGPDRHVAGSIGPTGKILMTGDITADELYEAFSEQATALEKGGADIIIIETMSDAEEAAIAVKAAKENTHCTVIATMTFNPAPDGTYYTIMGVTPADMIRILREAGADIIGSNCGNGTEVLTGVARAIREADREVPLIIQPNAGVPQLIDGKTIFPESPEIMSSFVPELVSIGVNIIGGCCGTTPEHIKAIARKLGR
ncbi:MAG TPA: homocysteine S-methyltransferase family protein [Bacteroidales bacterium]|nr:homocysteine S-methyltransferase family protein [Bacteroidales bacterium]HPP92166.1 homocysteine S-methyltransferase family protein [Bacteroidales bacterium]HQK70042.1 homocysteine S-methyltransferase family protein [Bacteroidales bacterium]